MLGDKEILVRGGVEHFWSPPPGEKILGMAQMEGTIVVATDGGIYMICDKDHYPDNYKVERVLANPPRFKET